MTAPARPRPEPVPDTRDDSRYEGRMRDLAEMMTEPVVPTSWRCEGFVADKTLTMLCGRAGSHKTFMGWTLARGVAQGLTVAGIDCAQGKAAIVDFEMGYEMSKARAHDMGLHVAENEIVYVDAMGLDLNRGDDLDWIYEQVTGCSFVLIDSLKRGTPGLKENDNDEMANVVAKLANGARTLEAGVVLIHHMGIDTRKWFRGATAIHDQCDALFALLHASNADTDEDNTDDGLRRLTCRSEWGKMRYAIEPDDMYVRLDLSQGGMALVGKPTVSKKVRYMREIVQHLPAKTKREVAGKCGTSDNNSVWQSAWKALPLVRNDKKLWEVMPDIDIASVIDPQDEPAI